MKNKKGFTLIELLVVIAIIALLSSVVLSSMATARLKSRDAKRISDVRQLMTSLELYHSSNGHYPYSSNCRATIPSTGWCNSIQSLYDNDKRWISDDGVLNPLREYINTEPRDPTPKTSLVADSWLTYNGAYFYYARNLTSYKDTYLVVFTLEQKSHPLESIDGVYNCSSTIHDYGASIGGNNGIITLGNNCPL